MTGIQAFTVLIALVACERLVELAVSKRNLRWSREHGGIEFGQGHYPVMVVLHIGLLAGALLEVYLVQPELIAWLSWTMFGLVLASQLLRWWCISTLGRRWNTRIVIIPGLPRVVSGPYRWIDHPNYVAVVIEGIALPMVGFAWVTGLIFTMANIPLLLTRIRAENAALASLPKTTA